MVVEFWDYKILFLINIFGKYILEFYWLKYYVNVKIIIVFEFMRNDLEKFGFKDIEIVYNGLDRNILEKVFEKEDEFIVLFVGRLILIKKFEDVVIVFKMFNKGKMWIVGRGEFMEKFKKRYNNGNIEFRGFIFEKEKIEFMKKVYVLLVLGIREGWGRVVIEVNVLGILVIGYNVFGFRDLIKYRYNGLLCDLNFKVMSEVFRVLYEDEEFKRRLSENVLKWVKRFSWDESVEKFERVLNFLVGE